MINKEWVLLNSSRLGNQTQSAPPCPPYRLHGPHPLRHTGPLQRYKYGSMLPTWPGPQRDAEHSPGAGGTRHCPTRPRASSCPPSWGPHWRSRAEQQPCPMHALSAGCSSPYSARPPITGSWASFTSLINFQRARQD